MGSIRKTSGGSFELCISNKLLPRRIYFTFGTQAEAEQYENQYDALLKAGLVPAALLVDETKPAERLSIILLAWMNSGAPAKSDMEVLALLLREVGKVKISDLSYTWAVEWVQGMKMVANYSPSTIRKRLVLCRGV